ncbi:hypothetical protein KFK09_023555 [Dendrobium nobile]|uniref:Uncharacterized protein n=1 Tax=Dendrobium nobile TaxID=94219 RepID=A0A8T3ABC9_DENNO|nr:hypothetical protein KFK09_023555 [Dendrobium nobile]
MKVAYLIMYGRWCRNRLAEYIPNYVVDVTCETFINTHMKDQAIFKYSNNEDFNLIDVLIDFRNKKGL